MEPPLVSKDYDPERHRIGTELACANWPIARSGMAAFDIEPNPPTRMHRF